MIQEGLYRTLTTTAGVAAIVSNRVYPLVIPERNHADASTYPCLVYTVEGKGRQVRFEGTDSLVRADVRIDSYARTYGDAQRTAAAVRATLVDYSGYMTTADGTIKVKRIFIENEADLVDIEPGLFRVWQQFTIWYDEG